MGISVEPSSPAARGSFDVSGDTSSIYVRYPVAPVSGDVKLTWIAGPTDAANIVTLGSGTVHAATFVGSGDASTTVYTLSHGIGAVPVGLVVSPLSPQARGDFDISGNASGIFVTYPIAPASGTVRLSWLAGPSTLASISGSLMHAGLFAGSGNNVTTLYTLSHGLGTVPSTILVNEASPQARGLYDVSGNASGLYVTYTSPPASGDVRLYWQAGPTSIAVLNAQSGIYTITSGSSINGVISGDQTIFGTTTFSGDTALRDTEIRESFVFASGMSGISFSGFQRFPTMEPPTYVVWTSGPGANSGVVRVMRTDTGVIEYSGADICSGLSYPINQIARGGTGGRIAIKDGFYPLLTSIVISGDNMIIEGEGWQQTQLRASGDFPAIILWGGSAANTIRDLYMTHNSSTNSGVGLLEFNASGGNVVINRIQNVLFFDFANKNGNAIVMRNTSGTAVYDNFFDNIHVDGFENAIYADSFGSGNVTFMNSNIFVNSYFNQGNRILRVKNGILGAFDNNNFANCVYQGYAGTTDVFDYETENSGHTWYTAHINVMVWDLTGTMTYAKLNTQTNLYLDGCFPTYKISGAGAKTDGTKGYRRYDFYTTNEGVFLGSGNASTTVYTFAHGITNPPNSVTVTPMSPQARGSGGFDVSGGAANITVTYANAPASGNVRLAWRAQT